MILGSSAGKDAQVFCAAQQPFAQLRWELSASRWPLRQLSAGGAMSSVMLASILMSLLAGPSSRDCPSATTMPEAFDRMRGHGGPSEEDLQKLVRNALPHQERWPTISVWHGTADSILISSTLRIATFWGLVDATHGRQDDAADTRSEDYVHTGEILMPGALTDENESERSDRHQHGTANAQPAGIQKIIEDALRAAGLMK